MYCCTYWLYTFQKRLPGFDASSCSYSISFSLPFYMIRNWLLLILSLVNVNMQYIIQEEMMRGKGRHKVDFLLTYRFSSLFCNLLQFNIKFRSLHLNLFDCFVRFFFPYLSTSSPFRFVLFIRLFAFIFFIFVATIQFFWGCEFIFAVSSSSYAEFSHVYACLCVCFSACLRNTPYKNTFSGTVSQSHCCFVGVSVLFSYSQHQNFVAYDNKIIRMQWAVNRRWLKIWKVEAKQRKKKERDKVNDKQQQWIITFLASAI